MIRAKIQIANGAVVDIFDTYGLGYLDSDKRVGPETKGFDATSYPEEEGEHIIPRTVDAAFDYTVKFFVRGTVLDTINAKIKAFNQAICPLSEGVRTVNQVAFYNVFKGHKIVGYPKTIPEAEEFWRDPEDHINDVAVVNWTLRVTKPSLCEYDYRDQGD